MMNVIIAIVILLFPFFATADDVITAPSYILVEKDSFNVISGRDYHKRLAPASTTKVMTTIVALEKLNGNEIIRADGNVVSIPPSKLSLSPGAEYRAIDLIKGAMVKSANDAAYAIAVHVCGSETAFADAMNRKAFEIGAYNTNFRNASSKWSYRHRPFIGQPRLCKASEHVR